MILFYVAAADERHATDQDERSKVYVRKNDAANAAIDCTRDAFTDDGGAVVYGVAETHAMPAWATALVDRHGEVLPFDQTPWQIVNDALEYATGIN